MSEQQSGRLSAELELEYGAKAHQRYKELSPHIPLAGEDYRFKKELGVFLRYATSNSPEDALSLAWMNAELAANYAFHSQTVMSEEEAQKHWQDAHAMFRKSETLAKQEGDVVLEITAGLSEKGIDMLRYLGVDDKEFSAAREAYNLQLEKSLLKLREHTNPKSPNLEIIGKSLPIVLAGLFLRGQSGQEKPDLTFIPSVARHGDLYIIVESKQEFRSVCIKQEDPGYAAHFIPQRIFTYPNELLPLEVEQNINWNTISPCYIENLAFFEEGIRQIKRGKSTKQSEQTLTAIGNMLDGVTNTVFHCSFTNKYEEAAVILPSRGHAMYSLLRPSSTSRQLPQAEAVEMQLIERLESIENDSKEPLAEKIADYYHTFFMSLAATLHELPHAQDAEHIQQQLVGYRHDLIKLIDEMLVAKNTLPPDSPQAQLIESTLQTAVVSLALAGDKECPVIAVPDEDIENPGLFVWPQKADGSFDREFMGRVELSDYEYNNFHFYGGVVQLNTTKLFGNAKNKSRLQDTFALLRVSVIERKSTKKLGKLFKELKIVRDAPHIYRK